MIEFCGEFSEESKRFLLKEHIRLGFFVAIFTSVVLGTITVVIAAVWDIWIITWFLLALVLLFIFAIVSPHNRKTKLLDMLPPKKIVVDGEGYISVELHEATVTKRFSDVRKVIDTGEWYYVLFRLKVDGFLCQKNLITKGTIEEFEKLFEDKLERKGT
jgi:hypothetical protein